MVLESKSPSMARDGLNQLWAAKPIYQVDQEG
jgi:hypothetical protein